MVTPFTMSKGCFACCATALLGCLGSKSSICGVVTQVVRVLAAIQPNTHDILYAQSISSKELDMLYKIPRVSGNDVVLISAVKCLIDAINDPINSRQHINKTRANLELLTV